MNPEIEWELFEFVQTEKSWNEICLKINEPLPLIAIALKQLMDNGKIVQTAKEDNIYYAKK
jgi:hypothetical protein